MEKKFVQNMEDSLLTMKEEILRNLMSENQEFEQIIDKAMHNSALLNSAGQVQREDIKSILEAAF